MPSVSRISIAPVKGLALFHPDSVLLERAGVVENRRFHVVDTDGRRYNQLRNGELVQIQAQYDSDHERLALIFPDGSTADGAVELGEEVTTDFYGRPVTGRVVVGPWSEALSRWSAQPLRLVQAPAGAAVDRGRGHVSLVSEASLEELGRRAGQDRPVDGRRFRMLFELAGCTPHQEDDWLGRRIRIGEALAEIRGEVGRCAITTQNPDTGARDLDTLRTIAAYRPETRDVNGGAHIPFGVFGEVIEPGRVSVADLVEIVSKSSFHNEEFLSRR